MPSRIYSDPNRISQPTIVVPTVINKPTLTPTTSTNIFPETIHIPLKVINKDSNSDIPSSHKQSIPSVTIKPNLEPSNDTIANTDKIPYTPAHNHTITVLTPVNVTSDINHEQLKINIQAKLQSSNETLPKTNQNIINESTTTNKGNTKDHLQNNEKMSDKSNIDEIEEEILFETINKLESLEKEVLSLEKDLLNHIELKFDLINIGAEIPTHRKDFLGRKDYTCADLNTQIYKGVTEVEVHEESIPASLPSDIRNIILHYPYLELKKFDCVDVHHDDFKPSVVSTHIIGEDKVDLVTLKNVTVTMDLSYLIE
jgi:hypothetical protein